MPTLADIESFISTLGFPIVAAVYFMWMNAKAAARHDKLLEELDCVQSKLDETKIQVGQVLPAAAATLAKVQATEGNENK